MQHISKTTKQKVIGGYVLLFLLTILSIVLIYRQIAKLAVNEASSNEANRKLFIVSNTITNLYEAETLSNAFIQTGMSKYFQEYVRLLEGTDQNIDSLRFLSSQLNQALRLDSINELLENKVRNLQELVYVKRTFVPEDFYSKAIANIESGRDSLPGTLNIRPRYITTFDSVYTVVEKKKRRRKPEFDTVLNITKSYHVIYDTLNNLESHSLRNKDTVVNILRTTWENVQKQSEDINRQISRREFALIRQSTEISDQLKRILGEYEKEEIYHAALKQTNREKAMETTLHIFAVVAVLAFLLVVLFTFFIFRDLSRSSRYRRELEMANQYADRLLKSREKMILTVTHDIKSPLSSILGYIELLTNTSVTERQRYFLKNMQGSSNHILQLVGNLLDLSKLENNKMKVEEVVYNPAQLFQEIIDNFMPLAANKQLELNGKFASDLNGDYKGDALRIRQIVTNILSNAVKYTAQGGIRFSGTSTTDGKRIILKIEDTGSGMTTEEQKLIFEEFTRLKSHSAIEGTGLGLTITLKLIHLLEGEMKLESEPGKGSRFTIFLPLRRVESNVTHTPATVAAKDAEMISPTAGLKVLLVDDDPLQLAMTSGLLSNYGLHVATTTHAAEVLSHLKESHYDLLFSDIQMPEMNGFELVKQIRALPEELAHALPVVALSADSDKQEAEYLQAGFTAYLAKPFRVADLIALVNRLTGRAINAGHPVAGCDTPPAEQSYTLKNIIQFTDNDPEALQSILHSFVTSTREHLGLLTAYCRDGEWENISRLAHKMLPLFRQLEAEKAIELLQQLEHPEKAKLLPDEMASLTGRAIEEAEKLLGQLQGNH